ncbi:MAG TPA: hypothetical protein VFD58_24355 [Blastocatellia bacterium]|nr:hypothetical protein [Blastocatellia bacterium]
MKPGFRICLSVLMLSVALTLLGVATTKAGVQQEKAQDSKTVTGKVASVDADKSSLEVKEQGGKSLVLSVDANTKVSKEGKDIALTDIKSGDQVSVEYNDANGSMIARSVVVLAASSKK